MSSEAIEQLVRRVARLPGLGRRSAQRIVLHLLMQRSGELEPLIAALEDVHRNICICECCGNMDTISPCHICTDTKRETQSLCVVESVADIWAIERGGVFRGKYHILGGTLSAIDGRGPDELKIDALLKRAGQPEVTEIILAMSATVEGQTTAHYVTRKLADAHVRVTQLAHGIPIGGELDYMDQGTLLAAFQARSELANE